MASNSEKDKQLRFGDDGELEPAEEESDQDRLDDFDNPLGKFGTKSGDDLFLVGSALQKAIRRSDEELAAWSAWELVRSGYGSFFWNRLAIIAVEEAVSDDDTLVLVDTLERLAKDRWVVDEWKGIICAIRAAIACARMPKSREHVHANRWFRACKNERVQAKAEGREPEFDFPEMGDEVYDQHTSIGKKRGRGFKHFMVHSGRLTGETEWGEELKENLMRNIELAYPDKDISQESITEEDIELAITPVEPGEHDDPDPVNQTLDQVKD